MMGDKAAGGSINERFNSDGGDSTTLNVNSVKIDVSKDADGEYQNTRGLDNHMLL